MKAIAFFIASFALAGCYTTTGWTQAGKTDRDMTRDDGECRAQANQECANGGYNGFCVNRAFGKCMEGRGWESTTANSAAW